MSNMSYCRFRNTLNDLRDCAQNFDEDELSDDEHNARRAMINEMVDLLEWLGAEVTDIDNIDESLMERK